MRTWATVLLAAVAVSALVLAWGYWYSLNHASLQLRVDDYALKSERQAYGVPHGVTLTLRDSAKVQLARRAFRRATGLHPGRSSERRHWQLRAPWHPSIVRQRVAGRLPACYEQYSAWSATWAPRVHSADVSVGSCQLREVPVTVRMSNDEWWLWWVPLPHVGGLPGNTSTSLSLLTAARARLLRPHHERTIAGSEKSGSMATATGEWCPALLRALRAVGKFLWFWCTGLGTRTKTESRRTAPGRFVPRADL